MIDDTHDLSITRQAGLLGLSRSSVYYVPRPVPACDLALMHRIDELHLDIPFATSGAAPAAGRGRGRGGPPPSALQQCVTRVSTPIGAHQTVAADSQHVQSSVDELYRLSLGLEVPTTWRNADYTRGWAVDTHKGVARNAAYATADGKRAAFIRVPDRHATIVILTNDASADARGMAEQILDHLLSATRDD